MLGAPNPEDPLNEAVAKQWKVRSTLRIRQSVRFTDGIDQENQAEAIKTAREWTKLYALKG